ncbi:MAG: sodium:solute symporter family protein [Planctomycetes bacterium]|nr:sodium:solute symporter family protein [Planctomycetota bacterium]
MAFTGGQVLAGAKLAAGTFLTKAPFGLEPLTFAVLLIAGITVMYTFLGGMKAVIYTDTIQWIVLIIGLVVVTIPVTLWELGGLSGLRAALPAKFFSLTNIEPVTFFNWMVSIIPIWLVGMTLYQRMYACRDRREAQKAWFIAGLFEYPAMAFAGAFLGLCARVWFPQAEPEMGLPMLIAEMLPIGVTGIVIAAYFSAIMSTADSCLMASSGNIVNDIIERYILRDPTPEQTIRLSQIVTLLIGVSAIAIAVNFTNVLDTILYAYGFMVSGLFVPTLGAYFWRRSSRSGAFWGMLCGGTVTVALSAHLLKLPTPLAELGLDPTVYGIALSAIVFGALSLIFPDSNSREIPS